VREPLGDVVDAGVLAVHGAEGVVDVQVAEGRQRSAKAPRSASSLLVSPASKRTFSSSTTRSGSVARTASAADSPTTSCAIRTGAPSSSWSRSATGARSTAGSGAPFGRPRWATTTGAAPRSTSERSSGTLARMRPSSVIVFGRRGRPPAGR
jgi:hypothetical protein